MHNNYIGERLLEKTDDNAKPRMNYISVAFKNIYIAVVIAENAD